MEGRQEEIAPSMKSNISASADSNSNDNANINTGEVSKGKWLADAKRFNAQKLRLRMKEQKQRFHHPNENASNVNKNQKHENDKENNAENNTDSNIVNNHHHQLGSKARPQLSIAISMSEEQEEENYQRPQGFTPRPSPFADPNIQALVNKRNPYGNSENTNESGSLDVGNASAWAMMENYYELENDTSHKSSSSQLLSGSPILKDSSVFWDKSFSSAGHAASSSVFSSPITSTPSPFRSEHNHEYDDNAASHATPSTITRTTTHQNFVHAPIRQEMEQWNSVESLHHRNAGNEDHGVTRVSDGMVGPTPAKLKAQWIQEKENDSTIASPPVSILQESMIQSDATNAIDHDSTTVKSEATRTLTTHRAVVDEEMSTEFSTASMEPTVYPQQREEEQALVPSLSNVPHSTPSSFTDQPEVSMVLAEKAQPKEASREQSKLQERVEELEQALRATIATPRGTIIQENPMKTLLDRNQTLVKEVRFADSTCVELAGKVAALEADKKGLQHRLTQLEEENKDMRQSFASTLAENASMVEERMALTSLRTSISVKGEDAYTLRELTRELKEEVSAWTQEDNDPVILTTSLLLSDLDSCWEEKADSDEIVINASQTLATALKAQVQSIKEQKSRALQAETLQRELGSMQSKNADLELKLQNEQSINHALTNNVATVTDPSLSMDLSRAQEESDFLGRQLGKVQDKLDQTRSELEEERKKSVSIDSKWRTQTAMQLREIQSLQSKLESASNAFRYGSGFQKEEPNDARLISIEQDVLNAKASLTSFKNELESLLSNEAYEGQWNSSSHSDADLVTTVAAFMKRMRQQYANLNFQVEKAISQYCERIEHLSASVHFLRSSLLFEAESVSTATSPIQAVPETQSASNSWWNAQGDASHAVEDEDDIYSRMEEARERSPEEAIDSHDISTDIDDLSRLLCDDSTLESIFKTNQSDRSVWEHETLKRPLEAAIRECQRVRDRCRTLKEELSNEKFAFRQLESENNRLVRAHTQAEEEKSSLEESLESTKLKVLKLEGTVEKQVMEYQEEHRLLQNRCESLEQEKMLVEERLKDQTADHDKTLEKLSSLEAEMKARQRQIETTKDLLLEREHSCAEMRAKLDEVEGRAFDAEEQIMQSRCSQEDMRQERAELKSQIVKAETETQLLRENLERVLSRAEKQRYEMSSTIDSLQIRYQESRKEVHQLSNVYQDIFALFEDTDGINFSVPEEQATSEFGVNWSLLEELVPFISALVSDLNTSHLKLNQVQLEMKQVQTDFKRATDLGSQYQSQVNEEKVQNQKLFDLLREAESEMERSATQIRELSNALSTQQDQQTEIVSKTRGIEAEKESLREELLKTRNDLVNQRCTSEQKQIELSEQLKMSKSCEAELQASMQSLETKSERLRQYVKKLTIKCEEWEMSYESQSKSLEKVQAKNGRMKEKLYEIASKYKELSGRVKSRSKMHLGDKQKWAGERNDLQQIHAKLERELENITHELSSANEQKHAT